jgi:uncharacterized protein (TIGR02301 family)
VCPPPISFALPRTRSRCCGVSIAALLGAAIAAAPVTVLAQASDTKPYDEKLNRLAEVLGAVHYLRELCGANEGQAWRGRMQELMDAEGSSALRKARLSRSFNTGYRTYSRTYSTCTPSAQTAINRFLVEGADLADGIVKLAP